MELFDKQGYNVSPHMNSNINEINTMNSNNQLDILLEKKDGSKKAYIKYHTDKSLRHNNIYDYIEELFDLDETLSKEDDLIIITNDEPNDQIIKILKNVWEQDRRYVSVYNINRLQFNVLKHNMQPEHIVLTNEEALAIKKKIQY